MLTGLSTYQPVDQRPAPDSTDVLVWYSPTALYFGIRAFDGREKFEEFTERVTVREIVDESLHRNPRAAKNHGTAQHSGVR